MKISVIVATLNSGLDLRETVASIMAQKGCDFEIIIKDGGSTDNSLKMLPEDKRASVYIQNDSGIYDAMNQAIQYATGEYCIFMNTGDAFFNENSLCNVHKFIESRLNNEHTIFYGDCYTKNRDVILSYPDQFDDYVCFSKVLCHQATIYPTYMLKNRGFNLKYKIAADYEYYVYEYIHGAALVHLPITIVEYKGDGTSETHFNRKRALEESVNIRKELFPADRYWKTWARTQLHGAGIKHWFVKQEWFYPAYKKIAYLYYKYNNGRKV